MIISVAAGLGNDQVKILNQKHDNTSTKLLLMSDNRDAEKGHAITYLALLDKLYL